MLLSLCKVRTWKIPSTLQFRKFLLHTCEFVVFNINWQISCLQLATWQDFLVFVIGKTPHSILLFFRVYLVYYYWLRTYYIRPSNHFKGLTCDGVEERGVVDVVELDKSKLDLVWVFGIRLISAGLTVVTWMSNFGTCVVVSSMSMLVEPDIKVGFFVDVVSMSSVDANVV